MKITLEHDRHLIVLMRFGSHLYGTNTPHSDADYKGVYMPSRRDIFLADIPKAIQQKTNPNPTEKNTSADVDIELYSLHYFINLACQGQTVAIDMLHAPDNMILEKSPVWDKIVAERTRFYTKSLNAFTQYARRQAAKYGIKGSRLSSARRALDFLKQSDPAETLRAVWPALPEDDYSFKLPVEPPGQFMQYEICGKKFQETTKIGYIIPIIEHFCENFGKRAEQAARNEGIDWKAISHALRAAYQVRDILTKNTIIFPLAEADYLREIKQGLRDYLTEVAPKLEDMMKEVEQLSMQTTLPQSVDRAYWDDFIIQTVSESLN